MDTDNRVTDEVEKTLHAFDGLPNLTPDPFLATRIHARLAEQRASVRRLILPRPALRPVALAIIIVLNILTAVYALRAPAPASARERLVSAMRQEYRIATDEF